MMRDYALLALVVVVIAALFALLSGWQAALFFVALFTAYFIITEAQR